MSNTRDIEIVLDGIRDELMRIRKILEREEQNKSMILQKGLRRDEDFNTSLF